MPPGRSLAATGRGADEHRPDLRRVAVGLRHGVGGAAAAGAKGGQELQQDGERVRFRVRRDGPHDIAGEAVEGSGIERVRPEEPRREVRPQPVGPSRYRSAKKTRKAKKVPASRRGRRPPCRRAPRRASECRRRAGRHRRPRRSRRRRVSGPCGSGSPAARTTASTKSLICGVSQPPRRRAPPSASAASCRLPSAGQ